ncbi:hypothetical protein NIES593_02970 [Hydrococcus rivularis NIES-593]|uniref:DUF4278 domain-containing protein n=1 Tax=Hydrococcus rivularis NIES-593 TaxID=1921803 RepID=A0A1U7HR98_9CYAN|nr:DUF4278 domain-containing protein [Hydrococcus rivularis]OKH26055.1 hypothetical protein NIES593_02970 [Hydrococcus rivularis NIES-593]
MKLTYRGVSYEYDPIVVETTTGEVGGKYRSRDWRFRNLKKPPILVPRANLTYRGVTYNKPDTAIPGTAAPQAAPALSMADKARTLMADRTQAVKKRQQSLLSRAVEEIGATDDVSKHWTHIQGQIQPTFRDNYDRFGGAVS